MRVALGLLAVWLSACVCSGPSSEDGGEGTGGGGEDRHLECRGVKEPLTEELLAAAYTALVVNAQEGVTEAPLGATGCLFVRRTVTGGKAVRLEVLSRLGGRQKYFTWDSALVDTREWHVAVLDVDAEGHVHGEFDAEPDGIIDAVSDEVVDADGAIQSSLFQVRKVDTQGRSTLIERATVTRRDATTMHRKEERVVGSGPLQVVRDEDQPEVMFACLDGMGKDMNVPCMPGEKDTVDSHLFYGVAIGMACLKDKAYLMYLRMLSVVGRLMLRGYTLACYTGGKSEAFGNTAHYEATGQFVLGVNRSLLGCSKARIDQTMFHEVMHFEFGDHDKYDDISKPGNLSSRYSDRLRGCEAFCFQTAPTKCDCAACLDVKVCDSTCTNLPTCLAKDAAGMPTMSQAVGAECRNPAHVKGGPMPGTWHATMAACTSSCAYGASQCKSRSLSCDPTCN